MRTRGAQGEAKKLQDAAAKQESARAALQQQVEELNAALMAGAQVQGPGDGRWS